MARVEVALEVAEIGLALADIGTEAAAGVAGVANIETITIRDIGYAARLIRPETKIRGKETKESDKRERDQGIGGYYRADTRRTPCRKRKGESKRRKINEEEESKRKES